MNKIARKQNPYFAPLRLCGKSFLRNICAPLLALPLVFAAFFVGCKTQNANQSQPISAAQTREVTDDLGRRVKIPVSVERAVSLAPNLTEIVFALQAGERLVGVTTYCNYPAEAQKISKVGDTISPNIETIIALKPQVVFVSTASQIETFTSQLAAQNIAVFVTNPNGFEDIYASIYKVGDVLGKSDEANAVVADLKRRVAAVEAKTKTAGRTKVFLQISKEPLVTVGGATFFTDLIERAGGASVTEDVASAYPKLSKETALALNPEAVILSDSDDNREPNDALESSPAVKNGRVYRINADILSRPAPRIVDALEQMAKDLHPEMFR